MSGRARISGLRGRLLATVLVAVAVALAAVTAAFNLLLVARLDQDANDLLRGRGAAALNALHVVDGRLRALEAPDDATLDRPIWVFAGSKTLEHPKAGPALDGAAQALATGPQQAIDIAGADVRLLALPVVARGRRLGAVVAGLSLTPYHRTSAQVLIASIGLALALLIAVGLASRWLLTAGLRPVAKMTADVGDWSERDLDRRFAVGPPRDEFTRLAATLDGLLDRLAAGLRRERRFSAELSHELRTPLSKIRGQAQLALAQDGSSGDYRDALKAVLRGTDEATRALSALMLAARAEGAGPRGVADARAPALAAVEGCAALAAECGVSVDLASSVPLRVGAEADLVERTLHPLIANACRYAASRVQISVARRGSSIEYVVEDDGPGVDAAERERIFEPGSRGASPGSGTADAGAGLGLALARRLARAVKGDVQALPGAVGARFIVRIPVG